MTAIEHVNSLELAEERSDFGHSFASIGDFDECARHLHTPLNIASHWESEEYRDNVRNGTRIALYELGRELGTGKFSKVKFGRHVISGGKFYNEFLWNFLNKFLSLKFACFPQNFNYTTFFRLRRRQNC
jgi:hypothetical protein